jgi:polysaccharide biosynthesis transport protein
MNAQPDEAGGVSLHDAVRGMGRWKWLILAFVVAVTGASLVLSLTRTRIYTATAELRYEQPVNISNPIGGSANLDPNTVNLELQSVGSELHGAPVVDRAAEQLKLAPTDKGLNVSTQVIPNTSVVKVSSDAGTPGAAAAMANAFSAAFIDNNRSIEREQLAQAISVVQEKLRAYKSTAQRASADYLLLSQQLNALQIADATAAGDYRVIAPALPPTSPSSPRPVRDAAVGFVAGLVGGIALALVLQQFSSRLRTHHEVSELLELPVVGRVPRLRRRLLATSPLVVLDEPWGSPAESFRVLRNNLDVLASHTGLRTILVTSSLPGEGKSVTVSNLAISEAMGGKRVVVIDGNLRQPRLHEFFGLKNEVGLATVVGGRAALRDALKPFPLPLRDVPLPSSMGGNDDNPEAPRPKDPMLVVMTSGQIPTNPGEIAASKGFDSMVREIRQGSVDFIFIDSPSLLEFGDAAAIAARVDAVLLVVDMESASKPVLAEAHESLAKLPCRTLGVVAVRQGRSHEGHRRSHHRETAGAVV